MQESKSKKTKSIKVEKNDETRKPLDLSASEMKKETFENKRRRSSHSSPDPKDPNSRKTKGNSVKILAEKQRSRSKINSLNLRMFVQSKLSLYKNKNGEYNGLVRILADAGFLQYCYMLIKSKPGNMSRGVTKETLDGISYE